MRLDGERYEEIKLTVARLLCELGADRYPLDARWLAGRMGVQLVEYSNLPESDRARLLSLEPEGCTVCFINERGQVCYRIAYNDAATLGRQRFTLLHEISHIALGHRQPSELAEAEANFFAKFAIAPPVCVNLIKPTDCTDTSLVFGTSAECAFYSMSFYSMSYYQNWLAYAPQSTEYERMLLKQFVCSKEGGGAMLHREKGA